ncbi:MAG: preprotein translocase subunit YajC [Clostridiales bacterium]|jgi:preprotein translocase subunit YajC|nr:preprotein translocase subunit YajC [Clostridiales bacterium]
MKKYLWMILTIVIVAGLAACVPAGGGGGGTIIVDGEAVAGPGVQQAAPPQDGAVGGEAVGAPAEQAPPAGGILGLLWPFLLMMVVVYFLIMRPQRKQAKQTREMQSALGVGDNIMTTSGLFGKIVSVGTDCFVVEFGEGGRSIKVPIRRTDIAGVKSPVLTPPPRGEEVIDDKKKR